MVFRVQQTANENTNWRQYSDQKPAAPKIIATDSSEKDPVVL